MCMPSTSTMASTGETLGASSLRALGLQQSLGQLWDLWLTRRKSLYCSIAYLKLPYVYCVLLACCDLVKIWPETL